MVKNLEMIQNTFLMYIDKKKNSKTFVQKSFSMFNGTPQNTVKLFLAKYIFFFLSKYMKNFSVSFQDLFFNIMLVIIYSRTFKYLWYKKVFLEENQKKVVRNETGPKGHKKP